MDDCPLCAEPLDATDLAFCEHLCPCGYKLCLWCWNRLMESSQPKCPACRSDYSTDKITMDSVCAEL